MKDIFNIKGYNNNITLTDLLSNNDRPLIPIIIHLDLSENWYQYMTTGMQRKQNNIKAMN